MLKRELKGEEEALARPTRCRRTVKGTDSPCRTDAHGVLSASLEQSGWAWGPRGAEAAASGASETVEGHAHLLRCPTG